MTPDEVFRIEWECAKLIACYANLNDEAKWDEVADLYTKDGIMARPTAPDDLIVGRDAILASFQGRPPRITRHLCSNVVIAVDGPDTARGTSATILYVGNAPPIVGSFRDRFERTVTGWRFAERRGSLTFGIG